MYSGARQWMRGKKERRKKNGERVRGRQGRKPVLTVKTSGWRTRWHHAASVLSMVNVTEYHH